MGTRQMRRLGLFAALAVFSATPWPQTPGPFSREPMLGAVRMFYAPEQDLSRVDIDLIDSARREIDLAAYVLTDKSFMDALVRAAKRGVRVRLYLHPEQPGFRRQPGQGPFWSLMHTPGVVVRFKGDGELMHLKSYQVDRARLRSGSANFSFSGMRRQDNDLFVIDSVDAASHFVTFFESLWARPDNERLQASR
ncbi:MAG: phosphatidylserine synthase [Hyphomicrobiales bacterium]|nr:phosphatidylserine synthase [Hyphomicrobiales bacterium]